MPHVVFLRAMNVGGKNVFRPAQLAGALAHLDAVNVGAAGTFLVRGKAPAASIRREILARLPLPAEMSVRPIREVLDLVRSQPFAGVKFSKGTRGWVAVLSRPTRAKPALPHSVPEGKSWSVRLDRIEGVFALGLWRRPTAGFVFPSKVVEDLLGVRATTRWWETIERIAKLVES